MDLLKESVVCNSCTDALNNTYNFISNCLQSQDFIENYIKGISSKNSVKSIALLDRHLIIVEQNIENRDCNEVNIIKHDVEDTKMSSTESGLPQCVTRIDPDCAPYTRDGKTRTDSSNVSSLKHEQSPERILNCTENTSNDSTQLICLSHPSPSIQSNSNHESKFSFGNALHNLCNFNNSLFATDHHEIDIVKQDIGNTKAIKVELSECINEPTFNSSVADKMNCGELTSKSRFLEHPSITCSINSHLKSYNKSNEGRGALEEEVPTTSQGLNSLYPDLLHDRVVLNPCNIHFDETNFNVTNESTYSNHQPSQKSIKRKMCDLKILHKHLAIGNHTGEKPFQCDICEYKSTHRGNLILHMRIHTGEKPFQCDICEYKAARRSYIKSHMRIHSDEKFFKCEICDYSTAYKTCLIVHMCAHNGEKPFKCDTCEYRSSDKKCLRLHMRTHTGEKPYECEVCEYKATQKGCLKLHMRTHTGEKPFECETCEYKSAYKMGLILHMRTHTREKPFQCELCDYKAARKSNIITHMRTHSGEKPFECEICEYKAAQKSNVISHMRTHISKKSFECDTCVYKSAYKKDLELHMLTHTSERTFKC